MRDEYSALISCMEAHVRKHVGPLGQVYHALGPELLHIDIFHVPPTPKRPCHTFLTCGMSLRPMCPPEEAGDCRFAELYLSLPPDWPVSRCCTMGDTAWPLRELGDLARLPHFSESWLWTGHTVGDPDPERRIAPGAGFTGWIVGPHLSLGHDGCVFRFRKRTVVIHSVLPIYKEEMELVHRHGPDALFEQLAYAGVSVMIDCGRRNVSLEKL